MLTFLAKKIAFGLQIIHSNRFKSTWNLNYCYQILAIALEFTCAPIYIIGAGLKIILISSVWHENLCVTWTQTVFEKPYEKTPLAFISCESTAWIQSLGTSWGLPWLDTYDQGVLEWCLSGNIHIRFVARLYRMNLMHGCTDNISHVPILTWPGMTSSHTWNDITQYFFFKFISCAVIWQNMSHFKRRWTKCPTSNVDGKFYGRTNIMETWPLFQLMCPPGQQYN